MTGGSTVLGDCTEMKFPDYIRPCLCCLGYKKSDSKKIKCKV